MKIDFDAVMVFTDIAKKVGEILSIRKEFSDYIYTEGQGIAAHALALKIYNGNSETEYEEAEVELMRAYSKGLAPCYIDAISMLLDEEDEIVQEGGNEQ